MAVSSAWISIICFICFSFAQSLGGKRGRIIGGFRHDTPPEFQGCFCTKPSLHTETSVFIQPCTFSATESKSARIRTPLLFLYIDYSRMSSSLSSLFLPSSYYSRCSSPHALNYISKSSSSSLIMTDTSLLLVMKPNTIESGVPFNCGLEPQGWESFNQSTTSHAWDLRALTPPAKDYGRREEGGGVFHWQMMDGVRRWCVWPSANGCLFCQHLSLTCNPSKMATKKTPPFHRSSIHNCDEDSNSRWRL